MNKFDYTVVGYYADNNQPYCDWLNTESPSAAIEKAITQAVEYGADLVVVGVFDGHLKEISGLDPEVATRKDYPQLKG